MRQILTAGVCAVALIASGACASAAETPTAQTAKPPAYAAPVIADANAMKAADQLHHTNLRQQLQNQLQQAGYTDVKVMPSSFYVQAKDKKGDPVAMVIGPDTFAEVTDVTIKAPGPTAQAQKTPDATSQQKPVQKN
jgi:hypothetical protein